MKARQITRMVLCVALATLWFAADVNADHGPGADIFFDDFEDGSATDGNPVTWTLAPSRSGNREVRDGNYILSRPDGPTGTVASRVPEHVLMDTSIRAQLSVNRIGLSAASIGVTAQQ